MPAAEKNNTCISKLIKMLNSENLDDRVIATHILGEEGDLKALTRLRERLSYTGKELQALVIAVGKLKRKLGVK